MQGKGGVSEFLLQSGQVVGERPGWEFLVLHKGVVMEPFGVLLAYTGQSVADGWPPPVVSSQGERGLEQAHHHSPGLDQVIF